MMSRCELRSDKFSMYFTGHAGGDISQEPEGDGPDASLCSKVCPQMTGMTHTYISYEH